MPAGHGQAPGEDVIVSADYTYEFITPLGDLINCFTGCSFPDRLTLLTSTDMRPEKSRVLTAEGD